MQLNLFNTSSSIILQPISVNCTENNISRTLESNCYYWGKKGKTLKVSLQYQKIQISCWCKGLIAFASISIEHVWSLMGLNHVKKKRRTRLEKRQQMQALINHNFSYPRFCACKTILVACLCIWELVHITNNNMIRAGKIRFSGLQKSVLLKASSEHVAPHNFVLCVTLGGKLVHLIVCLPVH